MLDITERLVRSTAQAEQLSAAVSMSVPGRNARELGSTLEALGASLEERCGWITAVRFAPPGQDPASRLAESGYEQAATAAVRRHRSLARLLAAAGRGLTEDRPADQGEQSHPDCSADGLELARMWELEHRRLLRLHEDTERALERAEVSLHGNLRRPLAPMTAWIRVVALHAEAQVLTLRSQADAYRIAMEMAEPSAMPLHGDWTMAEAAATADRLRAAEGLRGYQAAVCDAFRQLPRFAPPTQLSVTVQQPLCIPVQQVPVGEVRLMLRTR
ncbi:hypothetical protein D5S17_01815 [Pseudonocardiaceae bacterium YIM PH 21723]|nr:hypothetical protein D5S17_01815 [Pseudonocardiaceae bacterium YIM PH 21723]